MKNSTYIWDEDIIAQLCNTHLKMLWDDCWSVQKMISKNRYAANKNAQEFMEYPLHLLHRMNIVYDQLSKRALKARKKPFDLFSVSNTPFAQLLREVKSYVPRMTKQSQIDYLKKLDCKCKENL